MSAWLRRLCDLAFNLGLAIGRRPVRDTSLRELRCELEKRLRQ